MKRDIANPQSTEYQGREFTGIAPPPSAKLWSKAGNMSLARHDVALIELENGVKLALVIFTKRPDEKEIIPEIAAGFLG